MYNDLFTVFGLTVHGYGLMIGLGFLMAVAIINYRAPRLGLSADAATSMALIALVFGFLGAKLMYIAVNLRTFLQDPLAVLGSEGFVVYGGIILGIIAVCLYCRRKKVSFLEYFDLMLPAVAVNQAMGRIGCFLAGCCYGRPTDSALGVVFPAGCSAPAGIPLFPSQLFSAAGDLLIAAVLLIFYRRLKHRGSVGGLYLILYSVGRFFIEYTRDDPRGSLGIFSTSQFISLFILAAGILLMWRSRRLPVRADRPAAPEGEEDNQPETTEEIQPKAVEEVQSETVEEVQPEAAEASAPDGDQE